MKKDITFKIRLGLFISLGILIFIFGIYFIGQRQQLFNSTFRITGVFKDVAGLQAGSNIRLSGINVGTVETISLISDSSVNVEMLISESSRQFIKKDAIVGIGSDGLMGNKILIINPGTGGKRQIENNDIVETSQPLNMDEIFKSLKSTVDNASNITGDLSKITFEIQSGKGIIGKMLMDQSLAQNFDSSIVNLNQSLSGLNKTFDNVSGITNDLSKITFDIQSGKGTIGRLLMDESLAQNIDSSIINLNQSLAGINRLVNGAQTSFQKNIDSTFVNLKDGTASFKVLMEKAKSSWLLWGF